MVAQDNLLDLLAQAENEAIEFLQLDVDIDAVDLKQATDRNYQRSEKGRQTGARYRSSDKGRRTREELSLIHISEPTRPY